MSCRCFISFVILAMIVCCCRCCAGSRTFAADEQLLLVPRLGVRSVAVGTPTIVSLNMTLLSKDKTVSSPPRCDLLAKVSGMKPEKTYEARVSFAGSPPVRHELEMVTLKQLVSAAQGSNSGSEHDPSSSIGKGGKRPKPKRKKGHTLRHSAPSTSNRRLLDTERVQFRSGTSGGGISSGFQPQRQKVAAREEERQLQLEEEGTPDVFEPVADFINRFSSEATDSASTLISFVKRPAADADGEAEDATAVCIKIHSWGVPSLDFAAAFPPDKPRNVRFVLTVDEMIFGALPSSAIPSIAIAVFFVAFGVLAVLPRILKAL